MGVVSAKNGSGTWDATAIPDITDITVNKDTDPKVYASSSTGGAKSRVAGHTDASGSFTVKDEALQMSEGDSGTLVLKSSVGVTLFSGTVLIGDISWSAGVESGDPVEATVNWGQA